tara:strand:- start:32 stop:571 length:540 start_codon:yes stop_codon:yes gene_type:complete
MDSLEYIFILESENFYSDTIETSQTSLEISHEYFVALFSDSAIINHSFIWNVEVSDLDTTIQSLNGPYSLLVEVSELLIDRNNSNIPKEFSLHQNYPNPFNPSTEIRYDLPKNNFVNIYIYDLIGRVIKSFIISNQSAGYHSIRWNSTNDLGESLPAGVYFYSIHSGSFRETKKMVLLK